MEEWQAYLDDLLLGMKQMSLHIKLPLSFVSTKQFLFPLEVWKIGIPLYQCLFYYYFNVTI